MIDLVKWLEKARRVWGPETDENSAITEAITALSSQATRDEVLEEAAAACDALVGRGFDPADCALDIRALKQQPWTREDGTTSPVRTGPDDRRKSADGSFDYDDCPLRRDRKGPGGIGYGRRSGDRARWTAQPRAVDYLDARDALPAPSSGKSRIANVPRTAQPAPQAGLVDSLKTMTGYPTDILRDGPLGRNIVYWDALVEFGERVESYIDRRLFYDGRACARVFHPRRSVPNCRRGGADSQQAADYRQTFLGGRVVTDTPKPDTSDEAVERSLAQILYETDWPNSKDKWKQHHQSGKPDNAARRYMRLEQAAREYLQAQLTEAQEKQRKGTQPTAPEDMRRAAIRAALEAAEGRIRYLRDCYPTAEGITALDRAREELLNLSPDDILKRL